MAEMANMQAETPLNDDGLEETKDLSSSEGAVVLKDRFLIDDKAPLPTLNSPAAQAYTVHDRINPKIKLFALICSTDLPVQLNVINKLKGIRIRGMIPVIESGTVEWPITGKWTIVIILERPLGGRVIDAINTKKASISEYDVVKRFLEPTIKCLSELDDRNLTHRSIRPENIFFMTDDYDDIVLGECFTTPSGFDQPPIFETIPRSMSNPIGRGNGSIVDDLYSLGMSILFILTGNTDIIQADELDQLSMKILRGSYAAICGKSRVHPAIIEVLRGLLLDDQNSRWTLEIVTNWIRNGKRAPIERHSPNVANNPYIYRGYPHKSPITLAFEFSRDIEETIRTLRSDEAFEIWIRQNLRNDELAENLKGPLNQIALIEENNKIAAETLVAKICIILDPSGPIRFMKMAFMPDALGSVIAFETLSRKNIGPLINLFNFELYELWFALQKEELAFISKIFLLARTIMHLCISF